MYSICFNQLIRKTAFYKAIQKNHWRLVEELLGYNDILIHLEMHAYAFSALNLAVSRGHHQTVNVLLKVPAVAGIASKPSQAPKAFFIDVAASLGAFDTLQKLLEKVPYNSSELQVALRSAMSQEHFECALLLLKRLAQMESLNAHQSNQLDKIRHFSNQLEEHALMLNHQDISNSSEPSLDYARGIFNRLVQSDQSQPLHKILGYVPLCYLSHDMKRFDDDQAKSNHSLDH